MAMLIQSDCINCDVCVSECPNEAIAEGPDCYIIDAQKCTECVGHYEESRCVEVCPVDCIAADPAQAESKEELLKKFQRLTALAA
ncbi:ferredoxin [mine drainage metagenome]|uniref:Ferredoxin n=1 Tax=mine drainage metagenome TaxID=410659 RepID=A0A1J5S5F5_9ZZZZ